MVRFSHSVFALPFALSGAALAAFETGVEWVQVGWIVVAMVGARNAAMGFNRLADHSIDSLNPRTSDRELPARRLTRTAVWGFTLALAALFVFAAFRLGPLPGWLSPLALAIIFGYSFTKRFTWASHLFLGLALAIAPVGGFVAVAGRFSGAAWALGGAVLLWVAGFDIIYSCQDAEFDRKAGLFSIPARFGVRRGLAVARILHIGALGLLVCVGWLADLHPIYGFGLLGIGVLLIWEHRIVRADRLDRLGVAFFNMNGIISVAYLALILTALYWPRLSG